MAGTLAEWSHCDRVVEAVCIKLCTITSNQTFQVTSVGGRRSFLNITRSGLIAAKCYCPGVMISASGN